MRICAGKVCLVGGVDDVEPHPLLLQCQTLALTGVSLLPM